MVIKIKATETGTASVLLKSALRNFVKFAGKNLCQSLFFNKVAGVMDAILFKKESGTDVFL